MSRERENRARLNQIERDEQRGVARRQQSLDIVPNTRELSPLERFTTGFVAKEIREGRLPTNQEIRMYPASPEAVAEFHHRYEKTEGGQNGAMVEVRDHWLPEDCLTEIIEGKPVRVPLRVVTVTFPPSLIQ